VRLAARNFHLDHMEVLMVGSNGSGNAQGFRGLRTYHSSEDVLSSVVMHVPGH